MQPTHNDDEARKARRSKMLQDSPHHTPTARPRRAVVRRKHKHRHCSHSPHFPGAVCVRDTSCPRHAANVCVQCPSRPIPAPSPALCVCAGGRGEQRRRHRAKGRVGGCGNLSAWLHPQRPLICMETSRWRGGGGATGRACTMRCALSSPDQTSPRSTRPPPMPPRCVRPGGGRGGRGQRAEAGVRAPGSFL